MIKAGDILTCTYESLVGKRCIALSDPVATDAGIWCIFDLAWEYPTTVEAEEDVEGAEDFHGIVYSVDYQEYMNKESDLLPFSIEFLKKADMI